MNVHCGKNISTGRTVVTLFFLGTAQKQKILSGYLRYLYGCNINSEGVCKMGCSMYFYMSFSI
jgi:hypothetical protein